MVPLAADYSGELQLKPMVYFQQDRMIARVILTAPRTQPIGCHYLLGGDFSYITNKTSFILIFLNLERTFFLHNNISKVIDDECLSAVLYVERERAASASAESQCNPFSETFQAFPVT